MQHDRHEIAKVGAPFLRFGLHVADPMAGNGTEYLPYNRATCTAGFPASVGAVFVHCIDERIPELSGYGTFCASVGADALFAAREAS
jgi:hypothetical protein